MTGGGIGFYDLMERGSRYGIRSGGPYSCAIERTKVSSLFS